MSTQSTGTPTASVSRPPAALVAAGGVRGARHGRHRGRADSASGDVEELYRSMTSTPSSR